MKVVGLWCPLGKVIKIRATRERANGGWNQGIGGLTGIRNSDVEVEKLAGPTFWTSREADRAVHLYAHQPFCMEAHVCHTFGQKGKFWHD